MSPISNKRTDAYGGSFENRLRFPLSIAHAVRAVVPKHVPLGARITGSDWREGGLTADDAVAIAKALKAEGIDFICISSGGITADIRNPTTPGYNVPIAARVKSEAGIATRTVGLILKPEQAEAIVAQGRSRPGFVRPCLPRRSALGLARRQGARRRRGAPAAICPRRPQAVGAGRGQGLIAVFARQPGRIGAEEIAKPQPPHQQNGAQGAMLAPAATRGRHARAQAQWPVDAPRRADSTRSSISAIGGKPPARSNAARMTNIA